MTRWFTSDHHLWHNNIIRFCNRPFADVKEMNEKLLDWHNQFVQPQDHVYFLGDVTLMRGGRIEREMFVKEMRKYHGHKRLFLGNHDHWPVQVYLDAGFEKIYATWRDDAGIIYSHIPIHPKSLGTAIANVHGHTHNNTTQQGQVVNFDPVVTINPDTGKVRYVPYVNVSLEVINYHPISFEQVMDQINKGKGEYDGSKIGDEVQH